MAVVLAIGAALGFGTADFIGGLKSRRHPLPLVLAISQGTALVVVSIALIATRQPLASIEGAGIGFLSGVFSLLGLAVYYRGLAIGAMGVVGPIAATAVVIPLSVGLISGDQLSAFQVAGIALAIMGIVGLAYRPTTGASGHRVAVGVGLGVLAALGIGIYYSLIDAAAASATVLWVVFFNRLGAVVTITALVYPFSRARGAASPGAPPRGIVPARYRLAGHDGRNSGDIDRPARGRDNPGRSKHRECARGHVPRDHNPACPPCSRRTPRGRSASGRRCGARRRGADRALTQS